MYGRGAYYFPPRARFAFLGAGLLGIGGSSALLKSLMMSENCSKGMNSRHESQYVSNALRNLFIRNKFWVHSFITKVETSFDWSGYCCASSHSPCAT